ncbi:hypothetical protein ABFX02_05G142100 [Erythranthe guttata]
MKNSSDKLLLGHGIDIAASLCNNNNKVTKDANSCDVEEELINVSTNNGKQIPDKFHRPAQISSLFKYNFPKADRMTKLSPNYSKNRRRPAPEIRTRSRHDSVAKYNILDIDIDKFEEKLWRNPSVEMSDFFNYGLDEEQWKDYYCKLMQGTSSRQIKVSTYESIQSHKDGSTIEVNLDMRMDDDLPFIDYKDLNSYDSNVIIEIVKREHIKEEGELTDSEDDVETLRNSGNTKHIKRRMINGDKILPFPMDSYPCEDSSMSANIQKKRNEAMYSQKSYRSNEHNYRSWYGEEMVKLVRSNKTRKQHSFRKERECSLSHVGHENQKKAKFSLRHQTSHHKLK